MGKIKKEKISKNSHEKKDKVEVQKKRKNVEKKKSSTEESSRKYGYISAKSVITMAESAGFPGLQEDVARKLAEDVTYRLRYIIQQCKKYMIHNKQNKLSCRGINDVLRMCDGPSLYGHAADEPPKNFIYIREADVFVLEDNFIDLPTLALSEIRVEPKSSRAPTGSWLKPDELETHVALKCEEVNCNSRDVQCQGENQQQENRSVPPGSQKLGHENNKTETKIPTNLIKYYGITCNTILGQSDLKMVFQDLSTSCRILPIVPYLLNFITIALNKLSSERQIKRLLQTVEALARNKTIDFTPYSATNRVINAMLFIVAMDKKSAKCSYECHLRLYAARVLAMVLSEWCTRDEQKRSILKKMSKLLVDYKVSPKVHFGAIALLTAMGPLALSCNINRIFKQCLGCVRNAKESLVDGYSQCDATALEGAILAWFIVRLLQAAAATIYREPNLHSEVLSDLDGHLLSHFGDAACILWYSSAVDNGKQSAQNERCSASEVVAERKRQKSLKYMNSRYKPKLKKLTLENVFTLPQPAKKKNARIIFKFAGAIPVPEVNLKRRRFDSRCSQFVAGKESEGHVVLAGKRPQGNVPFATDLPVGSIFAIL
ncbi:hypothetical protein RUM43_014856 [Polyplax serrata]|uniref:TATA box binding protein associated factor (TAF) histone-like fold domain-containing protein n=1 Tax=Polyplax serrata TaxID=468196 RepID=A0AAN8NP87_POLSC